MVIGGGCLCGSVRYEISGSFEFIGNCHCSMCRKAHGAAFVTWGILAPEQFRWKSGVEFVGEYRSSPGRSRCFCRNCGSPLASSHSGKVSEVALGTLDGDPGARPREHIFVDSKAPWHDITDALPRHGAWPPGLARDG